MISESVIWFWFATEVIAYLWKPIVAVAVVALLWVSVRLLRKIWRRIEKITAKW